MDKKMKEMFSTIEKNYIVYESNTISILFDKNKILWFNASEVCKALEYKEPKKAITKNVDTDDKIQLKKIKLNKNVNISKHPDSIYINESGLYSLILSSRLKTAKEFKKWVTKEVIPSAIRYGHHVIIQKKENEKTELKKQLEYIREEYKKVTEERDQIKQDLRKEVYPDGGTVYAVEHIDNNKISYRIGKTGNMTTRKSIHNSHVLHKKKVIAYIDADEPRQMEKCIQVMLFDYRYKDNKDFYICSEDIIEKAFKKCKNDILDMKQTGGSWFESEINNLELKVEKKQKSIIKYQKKLNKI